MKRSALIVGVWFGLALLGVAGCGAGEGGDAPPQRSEPAQVEVTSDRSLIFTEAGQTASVSAVVVDAGGNPVDGAKVSWTSSDPGAVEVDEEGNVTSVTSLGSAVLTAEYQGLRNLVTAVVVVLRAETTLVRTEDVISVNPDRTEIELIRSPAHEALLAGDIVVNGNANGFLSRITSVEIRSGSVLLRVSDAGIVDAVEEMDLSARSPATVFDEDFESADGADADPGRVPKSALPKFECKRQAMLVNVGFERFNITPKFTLQNDIVVRVHDGAVDHLEIAIVGGMEIEATLETIKLATGLKGKISCKVDLAEIIFLAVPIFGPVALTGVATPNIGVELEAQYAAAELSINGLSYKRGEQLRVGFQYDMAAGYSLIRDRQTTVDEGKPAKFKRAEEDTLTLKVEPFLGLNAGIGLLLGPLRSPPFDIVGSKIFGGFELALSTPWSFEEPNYTGPRWNVYAGINADVNPLLENLNALEFMLNKLGLFGFAQLAGLDVKLFEIKTPLLESPDPTITPKPKVLSAGDTTLLAIGAPTAEVGTAVEAWAFPVGGGQGQQIGSDVLDGQGSSEIEWTPSAMDDGMHELKALLYDDIFGEVGLPYATRAQPKPDRTVEVGPGQIAIRPSSDHVTAGVGASALRSFRVLNLADEAVELEATESLDWLTITQNAMGTVPSAGELELEFEVECPDREDVLEGEIALAFADADGNPIVDGVPTTFPIALTCSEVGDCSGVHRVKTWRLIVSFAWDGQDAWSIGTTDYTLSAVHSAGFELLLGPTIYSVTGNGMVDDLRTVRTPDGLSDTTWRGSGPVVGRTGGNAAVSFNIDENLCTLNVFANELYVEGQVTTITMGPAGDVTDTSDEFLGIGGFQIYGIPAGLTASGGGALPITPPCKNCSKANPGGGAAGMILTRLGADGVDDATATVSLEPFEFYE